VFWAILRILNSVDQSVYWIVLIGVCLLLALRLIPTDTGSRTKGAYAYTSRADNRILYWQTLIKNDALGDEDGKDLRDSLQKLFIAALPPTERSAPIIWDEFAASRKAPLSPEAWRFLFPTEEPGRAFSTDPRIRIIRLIPRRIRRWAGKFVPGHRALIAEVLAWIETEMEINHDR
jgi:hypothetical protein